MTTYKPSATFFERMNPRVFFFLVFLYQLIFTFQGVDLSDEGFYATFYQQIFKHPEATTYNFMFYLSGVIGGAFDYVFHGLGVWGLRFAGVLVTTYTVIVTYNLLKRYLNPGYLKIGLLLVLLFINNNLKEIHYNDLSALFNMLTIAYLLAGLRENRPGKLFLAGLFVSLCAFTRLPNILSLGLGLGIFYYGFQKKNSLKVQIGQALSFGSGFIFMTGVILLFMKMVGHLPVFLNTIKLLQKMGQGGKDSFYGPMVLIKNFLITYTGAVKYTLFFAVAALIAAIAANIFKKQSFYQKWLVAAARWTIIIGFCYLIYSGRIDLDMLVYIFAGIVMITTFLIIFSPVSVDIKFLALTGCYILLTYPFSSSASLFTVGKYSLWLSFPIAVDYMFNIQTLGRITVWKKSIKLPAFLSFKGTTLNGVWTSVVIVCVFACLYFTYYYPFFDKHDRLGMHYSVNNKYMKGIYTTKERADVLNELLDASAKYVQPGEQVLAYHSIPMYHYWTETIPYLRNSMPWFYDAPLFSDELKQTLQEKKVLPVVVQQLKKTVGNAGNWPEEPAVFDSAWHKKNEPRDSVLNQFLQEHHYTEVWKNNIFKILVPRKDSMQSAAVQ